MKRLYTENVVVLCLALAMAADTVAFHESGRILKLGGGLGFAALFVIKGASRLQCARSDMWLSAAALILVVLSKVMPPRISPLPLEIVALAVCTIFILTGRTFRSIRTNQRDVNRAH